MAQSVGVTWSSEIALAVAEHGSMPGLDHLQSQYVRYRGQTEATASQEGWSAQDSIRSLTKIAGSDPDAAFSLNNLSNPEHPNPQHINLSISTAPAEFCLPVKNDRQFKPHFQVLVQVKHHGHLHLPLRMKSYLLMEEEKNAIREWLPEELDKSTKPTATRRSVTELKGGIVVSNIFKSGNGRMSVSTGSARAGGDSDRSTNSINEGVAGFSFPTKSPGRPGAAGAPAHNNVLKHNDSIRSQEDDPEMATEILARSMGRFAEGRGNNGDAMNTIMAQYEFKALEFAHPTRMNRVYLVFACLILDQDLLYTVYEVPCISICRAEQRKKALDKLGMPQHVYDEVTRGGNKPDTGPTAVSTWKNGREDSDAVATTSAPSRPPDPGGHSLTQTWEDLSDPDRWRSPIPLVSTAPTPHKPYTTHPLAAQSSHTSHLDPSHPHLLDNSLNTLPTLGSIGGLMDQFSLPGMPIDDPVIRSFLDASNAAPVMSDFGPDSATDMELINHVMSGVRQSATTPGSSLQPVASDLDYAGLNDLLQSFGPCRRPEHSDPNGPSQSDKSQPHDSSYLAFAPQATSSQPDTAYDNPASRQAKRSSSWHDGSPNMLGSPAGMYNSTARELDPNDATNIRRKYSVEGGGASQAPAPVPQGGGAGPLGHMGDMANNMQHADRITDASMVVNQQQAYDWIIQEYNRTGLQRRLEVPDLRALLSMAGFPEMAGLDPLIRVSIHQFQEFTHQFQSALAMLQKIAHLWNAQDPCMVSGFDMDRSAVLNALANEPTGTFICRFSMNQTGCLVLSCKVGPGQTSDSSDLVHVTINVDDLRDKKIDQLILDLPTASHVLDVYSDRRTDKRKILAVQNYMRFQRAADSHTTVNHVNNAQPSHT